MNFRNIQYPQYWIPYVLEHNLMKKLRISVPTHHGNGLYLMHAFTLGHVFS